MDYSSKNLLENKLRENIRAWQCVKDATKRKCMCKVDKMRTSPEAKSNINIDGKGKRWSQLECIKCFIRNV